ncbi:MAG: hypothetical protein GX612_03675 [Bacteroidales bacterium]|nr:hypothetical protein [Bacteroidales bacterium]
MKTTALSKHILLSCIGIMLLSTACRKIKTFPDTPYIEFVSFTKTQLQVPQKGILCIYFTDGDGDIGLKPDENDTSYNFFIDYYEKQNGNFIKIDLEGSHNARIPILNSSDYEKPLEGHIEIEIEYNNYISPFDTIQFECWLVDRAGNTSNHIFTTPIIVEK